jgi:5-methylcytosine-specific restriction endonuclease McrA
MDQTLLLSQGYEPLATITWQRAICLLTLGKVEVVETYDREIRSVHLVLKMPAVVRLINAFRRSRQSVRFSRQNVLARDRWQCQYCGTRKPAEELTYDHVVPRSQGGQTCWENIVTSCVECNAAKANRTPLQAGLRLLRRPVRPDWIPMVTLRISREAVPKAWQGYWMLSGELPEA